MHLIHTASIELREFQTHDAPPYAAFSHTSGSEEVCFQDLRDGSGINKQGFSRLRAFCKLASRAGIEWAWTNKCCVDNKNTAELSEAATSAWKWFLSARMSYTCIEEVDIVNDSLGRGAWSRRVWRLQKVQTSEAILIYDSMWQLTGHSGHEESVCAVQDLTPLWNYDITAITAVDKEHVTRAMESRHVILAKWIRWPSEDKAFDTSDHARYRRELIDGIMRRSQLHSSEPPAKTLAPSSPRNEGSSTRSWHAWLPSLMIALELLASPVEALYRSYLSFQCIPLFSTPAKGRGQSIHLMKSPARAVLSAFLFLSTYAFLIKYALLLLSFGRGFFYPSPETVSVSLGSHTLILVYFLPWAATLAWMLSRPPRVDPWLAEYVRDLDLFRSAFGKAMEPGLSMMIKGIEVAQIKQYSGSKSLCTFGYRPAFKTIPNTHNVFSVAESPSELAQAILETLFSRNEVAELLVATTPSSAINRKRKSKILCRLVVALESELGRGAEWDDQMYVAWLFAWRVQGSRIALQCLERATVLAHSNLNQTRGQQLNRRSTDNDRDSEDLELPDAESRSYIPAKIIDFCLNSVAYAQFKEDLLEAVLQPYKSRVDKLLETCSVRSTGDRGFATISQIKDELSWVPPDLIHFQSTDLFTLSDWIKERVELGMNEIWQWWPLRQRRHRLAKGWVRIGWTCVCNCQHSFDVPADAARKLEVVVQEAPKLLYPYTEKRGATVVKVPTQRPSVAGTGSYPGNLNVAGSTHTQKSPEQFHVPTQQTVQTRPPGGAIQLSTMNRVSQQRAAVPATLHVFLGVKRGRAPPIARLRVDSMTDTQFFQALRREYFHLRGRWKTFFSWWRYSHCDFYRFRHYARNSCAILGVDYPADDNHDYEFRPRPMTLRPPISDDEFYERFYHSCETPHSWHWHYCSKFATRSTQALALLPKRVYALELDANTREEFWGILAQEQRAFAWVLVYFFLCNTPGTIFFFLWLFDLHHAADLSNAIAPLTLSLFLTGGFIAILFESRDPDRQSSHRR